MEINYVAVLVAAVVCYLVGWAWYSPLLFVKPWLRARGKDADAVMAQMKNMQMPMDKMLIELVTTVVFAFLVGHITVVWFGVATIQSAIHLSLWLWVTFFAVPLIGAVMWEDMRWQHFAITAGRWLVSLLIITIITGLWH